MMSVSAIVSMIMMSALFVNAHATDVMKTMHVVSMIDVAAAAATTTVCMVLIVWLKKQKQT